MSLKQGLLRLRQQCHIRGVKLYSDQKTIVIPIYSFITQLITSMKHFLNNQQLQFWYQHIVQQHLRDRSFHNIIKSWEKLVQSSLQCHLLQTLLIVSNRNKLKLYLKARKFIIQTTSTSQMLDEILLNVQDTISIIHKLYQNQQIRKALVQGIKNIFMAFRLTQAKIYSSVFIEYLLTVYDSVHRIENQEATISANFSTYNSYENSNYIELYSSISNFQSGIHNDNGCYKKTTPTQHTPKKYQVIDRKFMPLKETSQCVSNQNNTKSPTRNSHLTSVDKQKSLFYEFITQNSQKQQNSINYQQSSIQQARSFSKSFEKQQSYFIDKKPIKTYQVQKHQEVQRHNVIQKPYPIQNQNFNKENSISPYKRPIQRQQVVQPSKSNPKFSLKRDIVANQPSKVEVNKNFALDWFSKKFLEGSDNEERQSILRKQKTRLRKEVQQKRKLNERSVDSTEKYEIETHLLKEQCINLKPTEAEPENSIQENSRLSKKENSRQFRQENSRQSIQDKSRQISRSRGNIQSQVQSVKKEEFQRMVSKNQQFKQKMLRKNFPSNSLNSSNNDPHNNVSRDQSQEEREFRNQSQEEYHNVNQSHQQMEFSYSQQEITFTPERLKIMKQRNQQNLKQQDTFQQSRKSQIRNNFQNSISNQKPSKVERFNRRQQNYDQFQETPQVIRNSIGQQRKSAFFQYNQAYNPRQSSPPSHQQRNSLVQKSSFNNNKMKSILQIIDDYRQNSTNQEYEQNQLEISESFYKKSHFDSRDNHEMNSVGNYSFD